MNEMALPHTVFCVLDTVARRTGFTVSDIIGMRRFGPLTCARAAAAWTMMRHLEMTYVQIGFVLSGRDHSTVVNMMQLMEGMISIGDPVCDVLRDINEALRPILSTYRNNQCHEEKKLPL